MLTPEVIAEIARHADDCEDRTRDTANGRELRAAMA